jgi:hypothetical protein
MDIDDVIKDAQLVAAEKTNRANGGHNQPINELTKQ